MRKDVKFSYLLGKFYASSPEKNRSEIKTNSQRRACHKQQPQKEKNLLGRRKLRHHVNP